MKKENDYKRMSLMNALAYCLDEIETGNLSYEDCILLFPQHKENLEALLKKSMALTMGQTITPSQEFKAKGSIKFSNRLIIDQYVIKRRPVRNINYKKIPILKWRFSMLQILFASLLALVAATGGAVYASDAAVPGDLLYGLDLAVEKIQLNLTRDEHSAAEFHLAFAAERLEEAQSLLLEGDFGNSLVALNSYKGEIASLAKLLGDSNRPDESELMDMISPNLEIHQEKLNEILETAPEEAWEGLSIAIEASDISVVLPDTPPDVSVPVDVSDPTDGSAKPEETPSPGSGKP